MNIFGHNSYHFIGIGGIGISAIAIMLHKQGKKVTGSDNSDSDIIKDLREIGIHITIGQKAENIPVGTEVVIYTIAIPEENPELKEARRLNLRVITYPEALGELSKTMTTIAVSGTHGKTTVTAMIGHILNEVGLDPTIIVGSKMFGEKKSNFQSGKSKYLVVETCEYKRSFLNLFPTILVITNIEEDHLDYYKDLEDIRSAFQELKNKVPKEGEIIDESEYKKITTDFNLLVPGKHNVLNAQAAIRVAMAIGVKEEDAKKALTTFKGTWRRLEYKFEKDNAIFYDDYAHHPTEIRASLAALREKYLDRKLVCVFKPHTISRTKILFSDFVKALSLADQIFVTPIYIAREEDDGSISNKTLAEAVSKLAPAQPVETVEELKTELSKLGNEKLCVVLMGAGDIYEWTKEIARG